MLILTARDETPITPAIHAKPLSSHFPFFPRGAAAAAAAGLRVTAPEENGRRSGLRRSVEVDLGRRDDRLARRSILFIWMDGGVENWIKGGEEEGR